MWGNRVIRRQYSVETSSWTQTTILSLRCIRPLNRCSDEHREGRGTPSYQTIAIWFPLDCQQGETWITFRRTILGLHTAREKRKVHCGNRGRLRLLLNMHGAEKATFTCVKREKDPHLVRINGDYFYICGDKITVFETDAATFLRRYAECKSMGWVGDYPQLLFSQVSVSADDKGDWILICTIQKLAHSA